MELVSDEVTAQVVDTIKENTGQVQTQATKALGKFPDDHQGD
jgi:hypothetical protein